VAKYGRNHWPRRFGGGKRYVEIEHEALLDALAPGWDADPSTESYAEAYAHALAISMIWSLNGRLRNQAIPSRMIENLPEFEAACNIRPGSNESVQQRRRTVAAKLRGIAGNTLGDIYDACAAMAGVNFAGLQTVDAADVWAFWPGQNPGPPSYEWMSNRAMVACKLTRGTLSELELRALVNRLKQMLNAMVPVWMRIAVGTFESGFIAGVGIPGLTLI
jgi:hypothetical protein